MYDADNSVQVNGVCLHYAVAGAGTPVVLVHGNGESHDLFDVEIRQLAESGYCVFAPDSRGHGANEPLGEFHYADMAEDMFQFIKAMGLDKPLFYGFSDGGIIGLLLEISHPGTLSAMAISGANLSPDGLDPAFLVKCAARNEEAPDPLVTLMLTEPNIDPRLLKAIDIPVLVTTGEYDLILPEETLCIAEHLPNAQLVVVKGDDHESYIAGSEIMGKMLIEFFGKV